MTSPSAPVPTTMSLSILTLPFNQSTLVMNFYLNFLLILRCLKGFVSYLIVFFIYFNQLGFRGIYATCREWPSCARRAPTAIAKWPPLSSVSDSRCGTSTPLISSTLELTSITSKDSSFVAVSVSQVLFPYLKFLLGFFDVFIHFIGLLSMIITIIKKFYRIIID